MIQFLDFISFYWQAQTIYSQDSPLIHNFCQEVLDSRKKISTRQTAAWRIQCLYETSLIPVHHMGSRSLYTSSHQRRINEIVQHSSSNLNKCEVLIKLGKWSQAKAVLELGTNVGIASTAFIENGFNLTTVEGHREIYNWTHQHLSKYSNCTFIHSPFEDFLDDQKDTYDLIFIDGDHQYDATQLIVKKCKKLLNPGGLIVLDDIRWSQGMKEAWRIISLDQDFNFVIDLFIAGILSNDNQLKQKISLKLIPKRIKPWPIYLFR